MKLDRRTFLTGSAALSAGGFIPWVTPGAVAEADPLFNQPYIDVDEWHDKPSRHRYVHGGFSGTDARFVMRLPPKDQYDGRFYQHLTAVPMSELAAEKLWDGAFPGFCFESGAMAVVSNQGGFKNIPQYAGGGDPTIGAYRVSAATAQYARVLAREMYGRHRTYGYVFGGSGGAFRTFSCAENTDVWDGVVPYIHGSAGSIPNNYAARVRGLRVLNEKLPEIADALEPGGGDVYAGLNDEERAVLAEISRLGYPLRAWALHEAMGMGAFSILFQGIQQQDPSYFEEFWTTPGYLGADRPEIFADVRLRHRTTVTKVIMSDEARAAGLPAPGGPGRPDPDVAWQNLENDYGGPLPVALQLQKPPPPGYLTQANINIISGQSAGRWVVLGGMRGDIAMLQFGPASGSLTDVTNAIRIGDEVVIDNSNTLAFETYYRHAVLPPEYPVYEHLKDSDGNPLYPQRPKMIADGFVRNATGSSRLGGKFSCKMIVVNCLLDWDAAPWHADYYRGKVRNNLGRDFKDRYRLWYVDHGTHGRIPDPTRTVSYYGVVQQALRDVSAWAEQGMAPPEETAYQLEKGQVLVSNTAVERRGIQPVVTVLANGDVRVDVKVGQPVTFMATIEAPPQSGSVVSAEWDFEAGPELVAGEAGRFPISEEFTPARRVSLTRDHTFTLPGTYFPALRARSHRDGDASARFAQISNLGRVRVVVT